MTKKIYYEKVGRKYVPIAEYDSDYLDSFPEGNHLVMCYPGGKSRRFNIEPNHAAMIAAGRIAEDAICDAIRSASEIKLSYKCRQQPLTPEQKDAWENLIKLFGENARSLEWPSARDIAEAAVKAMAEEAEKLLQNESVKDAYEQFQMVAKLSTDL